MSEIQEVLDKAAARFAELPVEEWAGWVVYLLEALDAQRRTKPVRDWLAPVRDAALTRLSGSRW